MNNDPKISVIIPVYNAEKYLDRCMKSIYDQTFTDYEIILVNDGSTDNSDEICRRYRDQDDRVTYIKKENEGAGSARNRGIEVAKGEYLAFPDVDDWFEPEMYTELYELAKSGDYDVVISGVNIYSTVENNTFEFSRSVVCDSYQFHSKEECRKNVMKFFPTTLIFDSPCNKLYRRSITEKNCVRYSNTRRCQDAMYNIDYYNCISSVASTNKAYYNYIENSVESTYRKFPITYIDISVSYYDKLISILTSWGVYSDEIKQHYDTSFVLSVYGIMEMFENPIWNLNREQQKKYVLDIMNRQDIQNRLILANIREDAVLKYFIIKNKDYNSFLKHYKRERIKSKIRHNKTLIWLYRQLKSIGAYRIRKMN